MSMVEGSKPTTEISNIEQIDEELLKEFLNKTPLWDFYERTKGEYMTKSEDEKKVLILSYYNYMDAGINLLFVCLFVCLAGFSSIIRFSLVSSLFESLFSLLIIGAVLFTTSKVSPFSIVFSVLMSEFDFKFELKIDSSSSL